MRNSACNLQLGNIWPDRIGPIVRIGPDGMRELAMLRWGLPSSQKALLDAASRRADKMHAKGTEIDDATFAEVRRMERDSGSTNLATLTGSTDGAGSAQSPVRLPTL